MSRFRGYRNKYSKKNRIYSMEELLKMSMGDFFDNEEEIDSQDSLIGLPTNEELKNSPNVRLVDSYTDESGQSYPARWESLLPTQAETMANIENLKNQTNNYDSYAGMMDNSFSEIDELTQESIEKLNQSKQENVQNPKFEDLRKEINMPKDDIQDFESAEKPMNTNNGMMSQLLNGLSTVLSMYNQGDMANNTDINPNEIDTRMSTIDLSQPDVRSYFIDPNQSSQKIYAKENKEQDNEKLKEQNDVKQQEQLQLNKNLADYINDLVGENIDYGFIGNEPTTSSQPDIPIYPENGVVKGGISNTAYKNTDQITIGDKLKKWLFTNAMTEKILPMASHSVKDGLNDMEVAKQNPHATVYSSIYDLNNAKLQDKCQSLGIPTDSKGTVFDINSYESKKIADAPEIDNYIKNMVENGGKPSDNQNIHLGVFNSKPWQLKDNIDRQATLQNVTIYEPEITEDGKFKCKIIDYSDFKPSKYGDLKFANDWGYKMQEEGYYKNYYQIYEIEKDIPKRYLKK